jgi:hypothetical protein
MHYQLSFLKKGVNLGDLTELSQQKKNKGRTHKITPADLTPEVTNILLKLSLLT